MSRRSSMNNNDVFKEQLIVRKSNSKDLVKKIGIVLGAAIVLIIGATFLPAVTPVLAIGLAWVAFVLIRRFNIEFEYIFTNGELDIDKIYNKIKRKHALTVNVRSFAVMVSMKNSSLKSELGNISKVLDYSTGEVTDSTYAAVYEDDGNRIQLIFDPNEAIFEAIKMYIPRKIK